MTSEVDVARAVKNRRHWKRAAQKSRRRVKELNCKETPRRVEELNCEEATALMNE